MHWQDSTTDFGPRGCRSRGARAPLHVELCTKSTKSIPVNYDAGLTTLPLMEVWHPSDHLALMGWIMRGSRVSDDFAKKD